MQRYNNILVEEWLKEYGKKPEQGEREREREREGGKRTDT